MMIQQAIQPQARLNRFISSWWVNRPVFFRVLRTRRFLAELFVMALMLASQSTTAMAQHWGLSVDSLMSHGSAAEGISGATLGVTHPYEMVPNVGLTGFYYEYSQDGDDEYDLKSKISGNMVDIFMHMPVPLDWLTLTVGAGTGSQQISTDIVQNIGRVETVTVTQNVSMIYGRVGYPFLYRYGVHLGLAYTISDETELTKDSTTEVTGLTESVDFSGLMFTLGLEIGFNPSKKKSSLGFDPTKVQAPSVPSQ